MRQKVIYPRHRKSGLKRFVKIIAALLAVVLLLLGILTLGQRYEHSLLPYRPEGKTDIGYIFDGENISESEYELIYRQTGLTRFGVDAVMSAGGKNAVLDIQQDFFSSPKVINEYIAPFSCSHKTEKEIKTVPLEDGDIIIMPYTHFSFVRFGHAAIVADAENGMVQNATGYADPSDVEDIGVFTCRPAFMIFRPKCDKSIRESAARIAREKLSGLDYSLSVGIFSPKFDKNITKTNCGHIVWYAYMAQGVDIDSNGGPFVFPRDIANSPELELLQVYGMDPEKLWK